MDIVFANFLWIIASLLGIFITTGASLCGLYRVIFKIIRYDEPTSVYREFKEGFKENFWFGTLVWFAILIIAVPLYLMYINALNTNNDIILLIAIVGSYQLLIFFLYFFPTLALFKTDKPLTMIKNVLVMANTNIWVNIKIIGSFAFVGILVFYVSPAFLVIAIGLFGYLVGFHLHKVFVPHLLKFENLENEEE
jgi:uncharacterized membrane protein YesL